MITQLFHFLKQPFNLFDSWQNRLTWVVSSGIYCALFLIIFRPYGVDNNQSGLVLTWEFISQMTLFGLNCATILALHEFGVRYLLFRNIPWSRGVFLLWMGWVLLMTSLSFFLHYNYLGNWHDFTFKSYFDFVINCFLLIIIPLIGNIFYFRFKNLQAQFVQVSQQTATIPNNQASKMILLEDENAKQKLRVTLEQLFYIEASDNYVTIYYQQNEQLAKILLRSTLKKIEEQLGDYPVVRCHRSFIVNLHQVSEAKGNSQNLKLQLHQVNHTIPVSRKYVQEVLNRIKG